jgi:fatty-acyl-CoA synthase
MNIFSKLLREVKFIRRSKKMLAAVADVDSQSSNLVPDDIERKVDEFADNLAFISDDGRWTYREFDDYANQVAHWAVAQGCVQGDTLAIFARNRLEYVALWYGLTKIGVVPALINYQLRSKALAHCITISKAKMAIVDVEFLDAWKSAKADLPKGLKNFVAFGNSPIKAMKNFDEQRAQQPTTRPDRRLREGIKAGDVLMNMFTSGTTGLPKAAKVSHTRGQYYLRGFIVASNSGPKDRMMMVLPMYHATGGLCGVGMALMRGGAVIVRPRFSVSQFWQDATKFDATLFMYVGELCRFLLNGPPDPYERKHKIRCIIGNGLPLDVWEPFLERFGIKDVVEFYGATEGNVSLINVGGVVGSVGRIPKYLRDKLNGDIVLYDVETDSYPKGEDGFYMRAAPGEIGELMGEIKPGETRFRYDGYKNKAASQKKVMHDVFKQGDMWFRTGDLFRRDADDNFFFVDRMGDTYRWKAENVATGEVAAVLNSVAGVHQANVYGVVVPGYDGKAGMASMVVDKDVDLNMLYEKVVEGLPPFARPLFLRLSAESDTTGTFKYKKTDLVKDGFDPSRIKDKLYVAHSKSKGYVPLDADIYGQIKKGVVRF